MDALHRNRTSPTLPESSIVLIGLLFAIAGLILRNSLGISPLLVALGIGLVIAGTVYIAVDGAESVRLFLSFISLVAFQLLAYGSIVRWIGGGMIAVVVVAAAYSRLSN